jgi:glycosyltransferase involved in cell wall biosynthesis
MLAQMTSYSIILPCYNEAPNITATIANTANWLQTITSDYEIIAVNDGSNDATGSIVQELTAMYPQLVVINHSVNKGYGEALKTGLDAGTKDVLAFMDSDGQFKAESFNELIPLLQTVDFVTGRRSRRADPFIRSVNAFLYGSLVKIALRIFVRDINCGMKMFRRSVWPTLRPKIASGALFNAEVFLRAHAAGIKWLQAAVPHYPRIAGIQTGAKIPVILRMFAELFTLKRKFTQSQAAT